MIIREYECRRKREQRARLKRKVDESNIAEGELDEAAKEIADEGEPQGCPEFNDEVKRAKVAKDIARYILRQTNAMDMNAKKDIFKRMIQHPSLKDLHSEKAPTPGLADTLIANIRNTLQDLKRPQNEDEMFLKRSTMLMLVSSKDREDARGLNVNAASKLLSIHRRNLYGARNQLLQQTENSALSFSTCHRSLPRSRIPEEVKELVENFWTLETRVSPNKKDICRKRIGRKQFITHPIHLLEVSQV